MSEAKPPTRTEIIVESVLGIGLFLFGWSIIGSQIIHWLKSATWPSHPLSEALGGQQLRWKGVQLVLEHIPASIVAIALGLWIATDAINKFDKRP